MADLSYWEKRQAKRMYEAMGQTENVADDIARLYYKASRYMSYKMEHIFRKYMDKHHLSEEEAFYLLNSLNDPTSLEELRQALKNKPDSETKAAILSELEAPAYAARIERLQELQQQTDLVMRDIYQREKDFNTRHYVNLAYDTYHKGIFDIQQRAGYGFSFAEADHKVIDSILSSNWSGENYSKRIWKNTEGLAQEVKQDLLMDVLTGRTQKEAADRITKKFAGGASDARRLIRTESNFVHGQMEMESYEECGIKTYIFVATLDLKTSSKCRELDGKRFPVSEQQPGVNCNPMHPWCRSTTICDILDEELAAMQRRAYDPKTKRYRVVPANMTYEQWYKEYVESNPEALTQEKMRNNRFVDKAQHQKYRAIYGEDIPKSFADFQELKYNKSEEWEQFKSGKQKRLNSMDFSQMKDLRGKLGNKETRLWYKAKDEAIPDLIDTSRPLKEQARQAFELRNEHRTQARVLMKDQVAREELDRTRKNPTFEEIMERKRKKYGLTDDEAYRDIIRSSATTNKKYDKKAGLEGDEVRENVSGDRKTK